METTTKSENQNQNNVNGSSTTAEAAAQGVPGASGEKQLNPTRGQQAYKKLMLRLLAIHRDEARKLTVSVPKAVGMGLSYARNFREDRSEFASAFNATTFDVASYDDMEDRAIGFWHVDILVRQAESADSPLSLMIEQAKPLRQKLLRTADYLWRNHPVLGVVVDEIRSGATNVNKADDLGRLATLFVENWDKAEGKCEVTKQDLDQAQSMGASILRLASAADTEKKTLVRELRDMRERAGEYLRRGIDEVREGAKFVFRGKPECLDRYPSLFAGYKRKKTNGKTNGEHATEPKSPSSDIGSVAQEPATV